MDIYAEKVNTCTPSPTAHLKFNTESVNCWSNTKSVTIWLFFTAKPSHIKLIDLSLPITRNNYSMILLVQELKCVISNIEDFTKDISLLLSYIIVSFNSVCWSHALVNGPTSKRRPEENLYPQSTSPRSCQPVASAC